MNQAPTLASHFADRRDELGPNKIGGIPVRPHGADLPVRRFWARRDGFVDLSDDGFLVDPESERARYSTQELYTLPEL